MIDTDVAVIGAGPAGLAAAGAALAQGCRVCLVDDQDTPGGQYLRQPSPLLTRAAPHRFGVSAAETASRFDALAHPRMDYRPRHTAWNLPEPGVVAVAHAAASSRLRARAVVIAAGAHDRVRPFPGWTLPGVMAAGGAQNLLKGQHLLPGQRIVLAGNGPLLLAVGANLASAGACVLAVAESARPGRRLPAALPGLLRAPGLLALAARYHHALRRSGTRMLAGNCLVEARGTDRVRKATLAPLRRDEGPDLARARTFAVDTLVVGDGLQCSAELPRLAGCDVRYEPVHGGWQVIRDEWLCSSLPWLFAAGDGAGIAGADAARVEGELAGLAAARRVRGGLAAGGMTRARGLMRHLRRLGHARAALATTFEPVATPGVRLGADTVICRCEDVTARQLRALLRDPSVGLAELKSRSRAGMGRCQGRNCLANLVEMAARARGMPESALPWPRPRPPARPVSIAALLSEPVAPPVLPEDPHLPRVRPSRTGS